MDSTMSEAPVSCARFHSEKLSDERPALTWLSTHHETGATFVYQGHFVWLLWQSKHASTAKARCLGRVPGGLLEHGRIRVIAPVRNRLDEHEEADETADHV